MHTVSIIGLGLIGGSLGLALKRSGRWRVVGYARRPETAQLALSRGVIDRKETTPQAAANADVVIICTPIMATKEIFSLISDYLKPGCVVSDVASTKVQVMKWAQETLPPKVSFVGGHPMAGKEASGLEVAEVDLFNGCTYCLVSGSLTSDASMSVMKEIVHDVGARPLPVEAEIHDYLVAGISHLPLLISTALVGATTQDPYWTEMARLAAGGYRDTSRVASTHPRMSRDICLSNRGPILEWLDKFSAELQKLRRLIGSNGDDLEKAFEQISRARQDWSYKTEQKDNKC